MEKQGAKVKQMVQADVKYRGIDLWLLKSNQVRTITILYRCRGRGYGVLGILPQRPILPETRTGAMSTVRVSMVMRKPRRMTGACVMLLTAV